MGFLDSGGQGAQSFADNFMKVYLGLQQNQRAKKELDVMNQLRNAQLQQAQQDQLFTEQERQRQALMQKAYQKRLGLMSAPQMGEMQAPVPQTTQPFANSGLMPLGDQELTNAPTRQVLPSQLEQISGGNPINETMLSMLPFMSPEKGMEVLSKLTTQGDSGGFELAKTGKYTPESVMEYIKTKDFSRLVPLEKQTSTSDIKEYQFAVEKDGYRGSFEEWLLSGKKAGATKVSVNTRVGEEGLTKLSGEMGKELVTERKDVEGAVKALENIKEAEKLINSGMITGTGAEYITNFGNFASSRLGINTGRGAVANTQAYASTMGTQVGQIIKQFGAGTGLSDADREYAEKIVGGKITLNELAIRKLLAINKKAFQNVIRNFNKKADQVMQKRGAEQLPYDLRVDYDLGDGIPQAAIDYLKQNPKQAIFFEQKYGKGTSKQYLGQ